MVPERPLRLFTAFTTIIALPLVITLTIVSVTKENRDYGYYYRQSRAVTTFCFAYIPLSLTASASMVSLLFYKKHGKSPGARYTLLDLVAGIAHLAILIPIWAVEVTKLDKGGWGLLVGYATSPMIVNMFIHFGLFGYNCKEWWSKRFDNACRMCPRCQAEFVVRGKTTEVRQSNNGEGYSLLRGEDYLDDDAVAYQDVRTSEEQIGPFQDAQPSGPSAGKSDDKGKRSVEV